MRFTLNKNEWYALELFSEEFDDNIRSYSPIRVQNIKPSKNGSRTFTLNFYHANYPEGVRDKEYKIKTIQRNRNFLIGVEETNSRILLFHKISKEWVEKHFNVKIEPSTSIIDWLKRNA